MQIKNASDDQQLQTIAHIFVFLEITWVLRIVDHSLLFHAGLEVDHLNQIRAVYCLAALFTLLTKKDKEKHPEYYWIQDYDATFFLILFFTLPAL